jgi:hypothetical protein
VDAHHARVGVEVAHHRRHPAQEPVAVGHAQVVVHLLQPEDVGHDGADPPVARVPAPVGDLPLEQRALGQRQHVERAGQGVAAAAPAQLGLEQRRQRAVHRAGAVVGQGEEAVGEGRVDAGRRFRAHVAVIRSDSP